MLGAERLILGAAAVLIALPAVVSAQSAPPSSGFVDELRFSATSFVDGREEVREDGAFVSGQIIFERFLDPFSSPILDAILNPRLAVGGAVSVSDGTDQVYAGLLWEIPVGSVFFLEAGFGGTVHNGEEERQAVRTGPELGCRLLFRESLSVGANLGANWRVLATVDHSSNAHLCDVNDGLTHAGLGVGYRF